MNTDIHNEKHIKEAIKKAGLETPSPDFVLHVMRKITASNKAGAYTPLISAKGWLAMAATVLVFVVCTFYIKDETMFPAWLDFEKISEYLTADLSGKVTLSKNMMYGMLITAAVILLQIPILKSWHEKALWKNYY